ncbi:hypothetical protein [Edaphobacter albus]|uniref:hypothetical protein n=1 Tax=Edaphobacter sp. 4G125 TaxID=2763071 RepID=UPI001643FBC0|nr:hypothetical protein [Edaphobacter sp. 4G125]QNI35871.1 hypothetical protein H7846_12635 [Edaphobacter sp. 4G125]
MLSTPFGDLTTLNLRDSDTQQLVLFYDKHQILEGLVAENTADQVLEGALTSDCSLTPLRVVSVVGARSGSNKRTVLVLDQGTAPELLHPYLEQLSRQFGVKLVRYDSTARDLVTHPGAYRPGIELTASYGALTQKLRSSGFTKVESAVRNEMRQQQGFWGQLVGAYGNRLGDAVVLPRLFKNFAVQPYFDRGIWDIDRVYWDERRRVYGVIEVKHKYPFGKEPWRLKFGINCGSCGVLRDLASVGFRCFHSIMLKPYWNDTQTVTYLFNDMKARSRVLFCGKHFSFDDLDALYHQKAKTSPGKTTLTGQGDMQYVSFAASSLYRIGLLNDTNISERFAAALNGELQDHVTDTEIRNLRLEAK